MQASNRWRTASLVAGALLIGSVLGSPLAQAVSVGLVRIESGRGSNLAAVSRSGQLSVNAGLTTTAAGQVTVAAADPRSLVGAFVFDCTAAGSYKIPAGKALIITGANFLTFARSSGFHALALIAGPPATPCTRFEFAVATEQNEPSVSQYQAFSPGIPVPAGNAVGLGATNDTGEAILYGYLVPAAAVPASALRNVRAGALGGPTTVTPPR